MTRLLHIVLLIFWLAGSSVTAIAQESDYFSIKVVDEATGRGVPLVELETIHHLRFFTDSNGLAAIDEPDLMGETVYFSVRSHGYAYPPDGFGFHGKALEVTPGGNATLEIKRTNIAERLYRATGAGIYRDTVLLGGEPPIEHPLLHARVFGCDSVMTAFYRGRIYWFWGDTSRPHYPIGGNFHITGATSLLPEDGGLAPSAGVNFDYFVDDQGDVRPMAQMAGEGPTWISAVTVLPDADGRQRMYAGYVKIRNQLEAYRWGYVAWDDQHERFEQVASFDTRPKMFYESQAHTFLHQGQDGTDYVYFCTPFPLLRVKADPQAFVDPGQYEAFTCLAAGTQFGDQQFDRGDDGRLRFSWKRNTLPLTQRQQGELLQAGIMRPQEALIALRDAATGRPVMAHNGSVYWNDYRQRWVLIASEEHGESSYLGEVWFAEADRPTGPWVYARKVVTHDKYSFYNPKHHPFFDEDGGRVIYFEGTYTRTFSATETPTPRYDYNQVVYRLDLSDPRLNLPVAVYHAPSPDGEVPFFTGKPEGDLAFFALQRPRQDAVPVVWDGESLEPTPRGTGESVVFYAIPADADSPPQATTPLYEWTDPASGRTICTTQLDTVPAEQRADLEPVCRVWKLPGAE